MPDEIAPEPQPEEIEMAEEVLEAQPEADSEVISDLPVPISPGQPPEEAAPSSDEVLADETRLSPEASAEPGPDSGTAPKQEKALDASEQLVAVLITQKSLKALWERADRAQDAVKTNIKALGIARELLTLIQSARNEILAGKDRYEEAERYINEVEFRIQLSQQMPIWGKTYGLPLFIYEFVWGLATLVVLLYWINQPIAALGVTTDFYYLFGCIMWGGIGGVVGALISLVKHLSIDQDFDRQHLLWYVGSPIVGYGVGAVIYLVLSAGLLSLTGPGQDISSPFIMYTLAWLCGYQQNIFTDLLKRVLKVFAVGEGDK
ncbi:MAG TPA: hypothetical protein DEH22_16525, partial [Chloroflexi bacterium]|nr:hypothetical protein [Chloroflexota bacterium]